MQSFLGSLTSKITTSVTQLAAKLKPEEWEPPWKYLPGNLKNKEEVVKTQILMLSKDKWNFLQAPTQEALLDFEFEYPKILPVARAAMTHDSYVSSLHYFLVPDQINDEKFWYNYFAHVHVIFTSFGAELGWRTPQPPVPPAPPAPAPSTTTPATSEPHTPADSTEAPSSSTSTPDSETSTTTLGISSAVPSSASTSTTTTTTTAQTTTETTPAPVEGAGVGSGLNPTAPQEPEYSAEELAILEEASNVDLGDQDLRDFEVDLDNLQEEIGKALAEDDTTE